MAELDTWTVINKGEHDEVLLAVDFYTPVREEGSFSDLTPKLTPARTVSQTLQPAVGVQARLPVENWLARWLDGLPTPRPRIRGVLGFCAGSPFAVALAERIGELQGELPGIVLFDPTVTDSLTLGLQYHKAITRLAGLLTEDEVATAIRAGEQAGQDHDDLVELGIALAELNRHAGDTAFERAGLDAEHRAELTSWFDAWVGWMVAAGTTPTTSGLPGSVSVTSQTPGNGTGLAQRNLRFDTGRYDLLRDGEVAAAVSRILD